MKITKWKNNSPKQKTAWGGGAVNLPSGTSVKNNFNNVILTKMVLLLAVVIAAFGVIAACPQDAHAYTYAKTDSQSIYTKLWIHAEPNGSFELIGSDPCGWWAGAPSLYPGVITKYEFATWSEPGGQNDIRWYNGTAHGPWWRGGAHIGHRTVSYNPDGNGWGNVSTYGYGIGGLSLNNHSGLDALMHTHVYQTAYAYGATMYEAADWYPRVKIQYNANGGSGAPSAHYKYMGNLANISNARPTRTGYTFEGWSFTKNGAVQIAPGQQIGYMDWNYQHGLITSGANGEWDPGSGITPHTYNNTNPGVPSPTGTNVITLYAQWKPIAYTISYNGNGATSGSTASSSHAYDTTKPLTANGFKRAYTLTCDAQGGSSGTKNVTCNWSWRNWNVNAAGTSATYTNQQNIKNLRSTPGNITLYAQWDSGSIQLPDPGTRDGYDFLGWYSAPSGGTRIGGIGSAYSIGKNTTIYAQWKAYALVMYYVDGETGLCPPTKLDPGSALSVSSETNTLATRENCAGLDGWYTDAEYKNKYVDGSVISGNTNLYGRNKVTLDYATTDRSFILSPEHKFYMDEDLTVLASDELLYPPQTTHYYNKPVTPIKSVKVWYEDATKQRQLVSSGIYAKPDATGVLIDKPIVLTRNTTLYIDWLADRYDGIVLQ